MKKIIILLTAVILASCGQTGNKGAEHISTKVILVPPDWGIFQWDNYSIQYPREWEVTRDEKGCAFFVSCTNRRDSNFGENINLVITNVKDSGVNLARLTAVSLAKIKDQMSDFNLISNKTLTDGDGDYQQIIFTCTSSSLNLILEQWYRIVGDNAYILTLTAFKEKWGKGQQIGEQIMSSFIVKN